MAEINIEKKKKPVWPWIVAVLLLVAVIWILVDNDDDDGMDDIPAQTEESAYQEPDNDYQDAGDQQAMQSNQEAGPAMAYVNFVEENEAEIGLEHTYTHQALTHLSKALNDLSENPSQETKTKIDELTMQADQLMQNTYSGEHADMMSACFQSAADAIKSIQQEQYPDLQEQAGEVEQAAGEITGEDLATDQKEAIRNFFSVSADAVGQMANQQNI